MKKHSAIKILAFVLALLMAFGVTASAVDGEDGPEPAAPTAINITVGQIVSIRQLVEDMGYAYYADGDYKYTTVYRVECSGAINSEEDLYDAGIDDSENDDNRRWFIYGTRAGQGAAAICLTGIQPFVVHFNITAASKPIVKNVSILGLDNLFTEPLLAKEGYTPDDIAYRAYWDVFCVNGLVGPVGILYGYPSPVYFDTGFNGMGESQILYNMEDGQVILINVTIKDSLINRLDRFELLYFSYQSTVNFPWNILVLLFAPVDWVMNWFYRLFSPTHQVTPFLTFE